MAHGSSQVTEQAEGAETPQLRSTSCPICGPQAHARLLHPANFELADLRPEIFSARRLPDRIHYRMVTCQECGLVRSDPVADADTLTRLYNQSAFNYSQETDNLRATYRRHLERLDRHQAGRGALLEIGCGNGFLLEEALACGYADVQGVEPSRNAIACAPPAVAPGIACDIMRPGLYGPAEFDVVCMFQVLDHIADPAALLDQCRRALRPDGLLLCFHHNVRATSSRLLGERSPIVDIEHAFLYSPATLSRLLASRGFKVLEVGAATNTLSLRHLLHLLPLPSGLKRGLLTATGRTGGRIRLRLPLGNLYAIARATQ